MLVVRRSTKRDDNESLKQVLVPALGRGLVVRASTIRDDNKSLKQVLFPALGWGLVVHASTKRDDNESLQQVYFLHWAGDSSCVRPQNVTTMTL